MHRRATAALGVLLAAASAADAQDRVTVIRGGQVHTIASGVIEDGVVLVQGGRILDVGRGLAVPPGAEVVEAGGLMVTPAAIDARATIGIGLLDRWETSRAVVPQLRILESWSLPENHDWVREGVTAVYLTPGPQNVLGGMGAVVKLAGPYGEALVTEAAGMSASLGEVPKQSFGENAPRTRMGAVSLIRDAFVRAQEHLSSKPASRDPGIEALGRVLRREVPLRVQANTPDDIMNAVRLAREFDLRLVIDVGVGAHAVAGKLAAAGVPVVVGPNVIGAGGGGRYEFALHTEENAARLHRAGVKVALCTDDDGGRSVVVEAAVSRAHGLPEAEALKAITLGAAEILGVADRLGSIAKGKDADLVIWKGHPLSTWGRAEKVLVGGRVVFDRTARQRP